MQKSLVKMRSNGGRRGPYTNVTGQRERERPCDGEGRDEKDASTSPRRPMTARDQQKLGRCRAGTLTALRGNPPHRRLDLRLLDPRPGRQYISAV